jgi:anti-sigma factor RsiW
MTLNNDSPACAQAAALHDYAFDELPAGERKAFEQHLAACDECKVELEQLRLTTAALRAIPEREIPQRIAFVSDRVFEPSPWRRFWNSAPRLGFASAAMLSVAMLVSAWHVTGDKSPAQNHAVQTASVSRQQVDEAIAKAVAETKAEVKAEDARLTEAAIQESERRKDAEYKSQLIAIQENFTVLQKRLSLSYERLASADLSNVGAGQ